MNIFKVLFWLFVFLFNSLLLTSCVGKSNKEVVLTQSDLAFEIIKAYADDNKRREPVLRDYIDIGLKEIIEEKVILLNKKVSSLKSSQVDTLEELKAVYQQINLPPSIILDNTYNVVISKQITKVVSIKAQVEDLDDNKLSYEWYSDADHEILSRETEFKYNAIKFGQFTFELKVKDARGESTVTGFSIRVEEDQLPIANAGEDKEVNQGEMIDLDGKGSDEEGEVTYKWFEGAVLLTQEARYSFKSDQIGVHTLTFEVTDTFGNKVTDELEVTVKEKSVKPIDTVRPVITVKGQTPYIMSEGQRYVDPGAIASDDVDGDLTTHIKVSISPKMPDDVLKAEAEYAVTYEVSDSAGNKAIAKIRIVKVVKKDEQQNTKKPVITLKGNSIVELEVGGEYIDLGVLAKDCDGKDISTLVVKSGLPIPENAKVGDTFEIKYNVTACNADASEVVRLVKIIALKDHIAPVITLVGNSSVDITRGETYVDQGATARDNIDGVLTADITVTGIPSTTDKPVGTKFEIKYNVKDKDGNAAVTVIRYVTVVSADQAPRILLTAMENVNIYQGETYYEAGVYAIDAEDGELTYKVVKTGDYVDTSATPNTVFKISFNVTDSDGNKAETIDKYVKIIAPGSMEVPDISERDKNNFLDLINKRRLSGKKCDGNSVGYVVSALTWSNSLYKAAYEHSQDIGRSDMAPGSEGSGTINDWAWVRNGEIEGDKSTEVDRLSFYSYSGSNTIEISSRREDVTEKKIERLFSISYICSQLMSSGFHELGMSVYVQPTAFSRLTYVIRLGG